jgi:hypothetical protein
MQTSSAYMPGDQPAVCCLSSPTNRPDRLFRVSSQNVQQCYCNAQMHGSVESAPRRVQCKLVRDVEDSMQLPCMINHHFEALEQLNALHRAGTLETACLDAPAKRLLQVAKLAEGNDSSSIVRFTQELGAFAVDPAIENRIVCVSS